MDIKKTANLLLNFTIKRIAEIFGFLIFCTGTLLLISLVTYSPEDPNFIFPDNTKINNILGFQGSFISDLFFQSFGLISYLISFTLIISGINIIRVKDFFLIIENIFYTILYSILGTLFFSRLTRSIASNSLLCGLKFDVMTRLISSFNSFFLKEKTSNGTPLLIIV